VSIAQIVTLVVDIGLGALAYRMARTAKVDIAAIRAEVATLTETVAKLVKAVF
jgi:hypothetical protein